MKNFLYSLLPYIPIIGILSTTSIKMLDKTKILIKVEESTLKLNSHKLLNVAFIQGLYVGIILSYLMLLML